MKPLTWNQIRVATLSTPADSPQATSSIPSAQSSGRLTEAGHLNPGPLAGLRKKTSSSSLGLRKTVSQLRLGENQGQAAPATANETLFRALQEEFSPAKVQALEKDSSSTLPATRAALQLSR